MRPMVAAARRAAGRASARRSIGVKSWRAGARKLARRHSRSTDRRGTIDAVLRSCLLRRPPPQLRHRRPGSESRELLLCHVTGQRHWDLPKGGIHAGETPTEAALRETHGGDRPSSSRAEALLDLGRHAYTSKKDLHLFALPLRAHRPARAALREHLHRSRLRPLAAGDGWLRLVRLRPHRPALHAQAGGAADAAARPRRRWSSSSTRPLRAARRLSGEAGATSR